MGLAKRAFVIAVGGLLAACGGGSGDGGGSGSGPTLQGSLPFYDQAFDLDADATVAGVPAAPGSFVSSAWDFYFANNSSRPVHAVLFQNGAMSVEISHLMGRTFDSVTDADVSGAVFSTGIVDQPFDSTRVVLVRTNTGAVYKVGNASEDATTVSFDYALLIP